jgi:nucleotide-binding universal stress UspA family protein
MDYASLMVHLDLAPPRDARLHVAAQLASRFAARAIGIAAADPNPPAYANGIVAASLIAQDRKQIEQQLAAAEQRFRQAMHGYSADIEWRQAFEKPGTFLARQARAADLIVTGLGGFDVLADPLHALDPSELVVRAGRPMLIVPPAVQELSAKRIVVGWKDTREARRAVRDALPLLQTAEQVIVAAIDESSAANAAPVASPQDDVVRWLAFHEVNATPRTMKAEHDAAHALMSVAADELADLLVVGAYGHSRLGEWVWGGVSHKLLTASDICCLMSH